MDLTEFLLANVQRYPGMFLMDTKLDSLLKFLGGYRLAFSLNLPDKKDFFLDSFSPWFLEKKQADSKSHWHIVLLEECNNSQELALKKFWEYLEEFSIHIKNFS